MSSITLQPVVGTELYCHYPTQSEPQPCFISLDPRSGRLWAGFNGEIGGAILVESLSWYRWSISPVGESVANALLESIVPHAEVLLEYGLVHDDDCSPYECEDRWRDEYLDEICDCPGYAAIRTIDELVHNAETDTDSHLQASTAEAWLWDEVATIKEQLLAGQTVSNLYRVYQGDGSDEDRMYINNLREWLEKLESEVKDR